MGDGAPLLPRLPAPGAGLQRGRPAAVQDPQGEVPHQEGAEAGGITSLPRWDYIITTKESNDVLSGLLGLFPGSTAFSPHVLLQ